MSQESQSDPSNHSDGEISEDISNPMPQEIEILSDQLDHYLLLMNQVASNRPLQEMPQEIEILSDQSVPDLRFDGRLYHNIGLPLYEASLRCDWKAAEAILDKNANMNLLRCSITENGETALHIAASAKAPKKVDEFVRNLVERMTPEDLELVNNNKSTALYLAAAAGNIETVQIMMAKNPTLDTIPGDGRSMMPLYRAVLYGYEDMARYLYECSEDLGKDGWNHANRSRLLEKCVESDMFGIAINIVTKYPDLGSRSYSLGLLARKPEAFHKKCSITKSNIKLVSAFIGYKAGPRVEEKDYALELLVILWENIVTLSMTDMDHILRGPPDSIKSGFGRIHQTRQLKALIFFRLEKLEKEIDKIMEGTQQVSKLKDLISKYVVDMHFETQLLIKKENTTDEDQALELQKLISEFIVKLHDETEDMPANGIFENGDLAWRLKYLIFEMRSETNKIDTRSYSSRVLFIAAEVGNINFLLQLFRRSPDLVWKVNDNNQTIFHVAVKHRYEGIYNLLYEIDHSVKDKVTPLKDNDGNNMLHLAAMRTSKKNHEDVPGAALQMQRELLWFKKVEHMIPPSCRVSKNKDGLTPRELFTMEHQYLINQGEIWMKETASQCMVVATLIATIVFAAAFTVPGGYNQNDGIPMFNRKLSFAVFVVADAMSLFLSSTSILIFLSFFISSRYAERDFEASLQRKLILGLATLYLSIGTMMVAFCVSFFLLYHREMKWIPIFISIFAFIPAILYVALQSHLLVDVFRSTYGGKYLFKPEKQVLFYYENPKVQPNIVFQL